MTKLWPQSLTGRVLLVILAALLGSETVLTLVLKDREMTVAQDLIEHQALLQTVALSRMAEAAPPADFAILAAAFASRGMCVRVLNTAPPASTMDDGEVEFADTLRHMLDLPDNQPVQVRLQKQHQAQLSCNSDAGPARPPVKAMMVTTIVPVGAQGWLSVETLVELPGTDNLTIIIILLVTAAMVGGVAVAALRTQTRSLRRLAAASERFGRGEEVAALEETGPSDVLAATRAFNSMQDRQRSFVRDRIGLLAAVSHDLRTPLTTLRLKAEFVTPDASRDSLIATIDEMTVITEATLAFTKAEASREPTTTVDITALLATIRDESVAAGHQVSLTDAAPHFAACRPVAIKRALRNLVENAVRYGGSAMLSLDRQGAALLIRVEDAGPGIAPDQLDHVLKPFVRLETSRNAETGGIGMGLAIAQGIISAHGGTLRLSNRPEGGLCVEIVLQV